MPALTKAQLNHATQRVAEARAQFIYERAKALGPKPEAPVITNADKLAAISNGTAKLGSSGLEYYGYLHNAFDYPLSPEQQAQQDARDRWQQAYDAITAEAARIESGLIDELVMSPDGVSALKRIADAFTVPTP